MHIFRFPHASISQKDIIKKLVFPVYFLSAFIDNIVINI